MVVLSNKPVNPSRDIVQALGLGGFFVRVYPGVVTALRPRSPIRWGADEYCRRLALRRDEALILETHRSMSLTGATPGCGRAVLPTASLRILWKKVPPDVLIESPRELGRVVPGASETKAEYLNRSAAPAYFGFSEGAI